MAKPIEPGCLAIIIKSKKTENVGRVVRVLTFLGYPIRLPLNTRAEYLIPFEGQYWSIDHKHSRCWSIQLLDGQIAVSVFYDHFKESSSNNQQYVVDATCPIAVCEEDRLMRIDSDDLDEEEIRQEELVYVS